MIIFTASAALSVAIQSYCPPAQHVLFCVASMNRTIRGRGVSTNTTPAVTLVWTMTQHLQQPKDFIPNHFVVLHPVQTDQVETELSDDQLSTSFNVSLPLSEVADQVSETSLLCPPPDDIIAEQPISFEIVEGGLKKGGDIVVDTCGFTYARTFVGKTTTTWICSARGSKKCFSTVNQRGTTFTKGKRHAHNHPAETGALLRCKATKMVI